MSKTGHQALANSQPDQAHGKHAALAATRPLFGEPAGDQVESVCQLFDRDGEQRLGVERCHRVPVDTVAVKMNSGTRLSTVNSTPLSAIPWRASGRMIWSVRAVPRSSSRRRSAARAPGSGRRRWRPPPGPDPPRRRPRRRPDAVDGTLPAAAARCASCSSGVAESRLICRARLSRGMAEPEEPASASARQALRSQHA